jgi:hypothetical protein
LPFQHEKSTRKDGNVGTSFVKEKVRGATESERRLKALRVRVEVRKKVEEG